MMSKPVGKIAFYFTLLYAILIGSIFNFYTDILSGYNKNLASTQNKITGVKYLKLLHKLSADTINMQGHGILKQSMQANIKAIYTFQRIHPEFHNSTLNKHLESIDKLHENHKDAHYYDFFDYMNHENYIVGNKAEILFSQDKEQYFLGTLMTHYLPEFLISLGISHNILEDFVESRDMDATKKSIYIEQNKLVYLSSEELHNIISLLREYVDTKNLQNIIEKVHKTLEQLKASKGGLVILNDNGKSFESRLKTTHKLVDLAEELNYQNTKLLEKLLANDEKYFSDKIIYYRYLLIFMLILVTAIFIYSFRIVNSNIKKDKELEELNESLLRRVNEEVSQNRKKDKQMMQQSRLAQMGEMIGMIAHQWRQPLSAISATTASMHLKAKVNKLDKDTALELSERISDYSQHLSSTIDDFRDFFKPNKEKRETSYNELVQSVLGIIEVSIINKNIELIQELESENTFNTYPNEIKQVILNLIKNAEEVLIEKKIINPKITIKTSGTILTVSDNGGGVSEEIIDNVFDPYFSTKVKKDGTGLGLYMSKIIIEEHCGGKLSVYNDKDGAAFKIILGADSD
ncbi:MAG: HAMP domain-containing sensor histidine kinase [Campylobacterota bacterium]|nr:HAMP domain-containing sensor histidine kinase [Campylobacterota bacterium]